MKWIYRLFTFAILGVALGLPFFIDNKDGKPMLSLPGSDDLLPDKAKVMPPTTVYKWRDVNDQWHYGDSPPANARDLTPMQINTNTNIVQSVKVPQEEPEAMLTPVNGQAKAYQPPASTEDLLTVENAMNLMNDARAVRDQMEARNSQLNRIVGEQNQ